MYLCQHKEYWTLQHHHLPQKCLTSWALIISYPFVCSLLFASNRHFNDDVIVLFIKAALWEFSIVLTLLSYLAFLSQCSTHNENRSVPVSTSLNKILIKLKSFIWQNLKGKINTHTKPRKTCNVPLPWAWPLSLQRSASCSAGSSSRACHSSWPAALDIWTLAEFSDPPCKHRHMKKNVKSLPAQSNTDSHIGSMYSPFLFHRKF